MINHDFFDLVNLFWFYFIRINIALGVFNLIPLYPLDGYRLVGIFSKDAYNRMRRNATLITI
ncbi:MAG: site-2 protease family protein [Patescibacteria group bacterium]|nr:site-2 protease family protein [Patescibacteria group bacterium]